MGERKRELRISRRQFLRSSSALAAGASLGAAAGCAPAPEEVPDAPPRRIPVALQLYSVRDKAPEDFPGVLQAVAQMGYEGVEFAGYHGYGAAELHRFLDDVGLRSAGSHVRLAALLEDRLEETVEFNRILGSPSLVVPFHAEERPDTEEGWRRLGDTFNEIAQGLEPHGLRVGYHNYDEEFRPLNGELPWHVFARSTSHEVILQLDTAAATRGGGEVISLLAPYPGRIYSIHLEDHAPDGSVVLPGDGVVPFPEVLDLCRTAGGTEWFIIEQERHPEPYTSLESVEECLRRLRAMLG